MDRGKLGNEGWILLFSIFASTISLLPRASSRLSMKLTITCPPRSFHLLTFSQLCESQSSSEPTHPNLPRRALNIPCLRPGFAFNFNLIEFAPCMRQFFEASSPPVLLTQKALGEYCCRRQSWGLGQLSSSLICVRALLTVPGPIESNQISIRGASGHTLWLKDLKMVLLEE